MHSFKLLYLVLLLPQHKLSSGYHESELKQGTGLGYSNILDVANALHVKSFSITSEKRATAMDEDCSHACDNNAVTSLDSSPPFLEISAYISCLSKCDPM